MKYTKQTLVVIVSKYRTYNTKKNEVMGFVTVEDLSGSMDMLVFPNVFREVSDIINENNVLIVNGTVSLKDDEATILADSVYEIGSEEAGHILAAKKDPKYGLYIKVDGQNTPQFRQCCGVLARYSGMMPVYFYLQDKKQYVKAPQRLWIRESINALDELKYVVGESNVVIRK